MPMFCLMFMVWLLGAAADVTRCAYPNECFEQLPWDTLERRGNLERIPEYHPLKNTSYSTDALWMTSQPSYTFHSGMSGSPVTQGWANANATSAKVVILRNSDDAVEAMRFVAENKVAVTVRGTGHDWFGRSSGSGTLLLWTHHLNETLWHDDYTPSGCNETIDGAVTLGAGVQWWQLYSEVNERRIVAVGGTCATVGHVGFTLGGGYGDVSRMYGSGASNLVEAEVVLASGKKVTTNMCKHADLFRALRGGGGGFGLVTKATYRTYPWPEWLGSATVTLEGVADGFKQFGRWYRSIVHQGLSKHFGGQVQINGYAGDNHILIELIYNGPSSKHCRTLLQNLSADVKCDFVSSFGKDPVESAVGAPGWENSWLQGQASAYNELSMSRYFFLEDIEEGTLESFADAMDRLARIPFLADAGIIIGLNYGLGHGSDTALAHLNETLVHPQVSKSLGTVKLDVKRVRSRHFEPGNNTAMNSEAWETLQTVRNVLDELLVDRGSYNNEGDYTELAWQDRYWGSNYEELLRTKLKYDPDNIFSCHQCVGSEKKSSREAERHTHRLRGARIDRHIPAYPFV